MTIANIVWLVSGMFFGICLGIVIMSLMVASRESERWETFEKMVNRDRYTLEDISEHDIDCVSYYIVGETGYAPDPGMVEYYIRERFSLDGQGDENGYVLWVKNNPEEVAKELAQHVQNMKRKIIGRGV